MKDKIMPPLVLTIICIVVSGLLVLAYNATYVDNTGVLTDDMKKGCEEIFGKGDYEIMLDGEGDSKTPVTFDTEGVNSIITDKDNGRCVIEITEDGYSKGGLHLLIGINSEGTVEGIEFLSIGETPGLGTMAEKNSNLYEFTKGIIKQNPTLVTLLGMCPTLAVTTMAKNGIGMGLATTFVLVCSNFVISLLKNVIPKAVRLPCFIVIIAGFVTLIEFLMKGYIPELYSALGVFLSLITVNCIILGRAEAFASKNKIFPSILDGLGMGLGFTLSLFTMGSIREILGTGSWFGFKIPFLCDDPMTVFIMPAGGFFVLGCLIALVNKIANKKPPKEISCSGCPNAALCKGQCRTESEEA